MLARRSSMAVCLAASHMLLVWPVGASVWDFLDDMLCQVPDGAVLRYAFCCPEPVLIEKQLPILPSHSLKDDPQRYRDVKRHIVKTPTRKSAQTINVVFRDLFGIDFTRLSAPNGPSKQSSIKDFFLCFSPAGCERYEPDKEKRRALHWRTSQEHDLFVDFLKANGAENIYSMQDIGSSKIVNNGAWSCFWEGLQKSGATGALIVR